jgi:hypothetical protein
MRKKNLIPKSYRTPPQIQSRMTSKDDVKKCIVQALTMVGGADYLVAVARTQPRVFCSLLANLLNRKEPLPAGGQEGRLTALSDEMLRSKLLLALSSQGAPELSRSSVDSETVRA